MERKLPDIRDSAGRLVDKELTGTVIKCFYFTYNVLGFGFLESVYRNALALELNARNLSVKQEASVNVCYRDSIVGHFRLDLLVEGRLAVELKASSVLGPTDQRQLLNYLKAGCLDIGLLLHFGPEPRFHRLVHPRLLRR